MIRSGKTWKDKINIACCDVITGYPLYLFVSALIKRPSGLTESAIRYGILERVYSKFRLFFYIRTVFTLGQLQLISNDAIPYGYEDWMWDWLKPMEGDVILDIGAHVGIIALHAARMTGPTGLVIAVEADHLNYVILVENIRRNKLSNIIPLRFAAWNKDSEIELYHGQLSIMHSVKRSADHRGFAFDSSTNITLVKAGRVDDAVEDLKLESVNWIKIDVEGAEIEVLQGLERTIRRWHPKIIVESKGSNQGRLRNYFFHYDYEIRQINTENFYCCYQD